MALSVQTFMLASVPGASLDALGWLVSLPGALFHAYAWLIETAADWVRSLFEGYGYLVVFFGTLLENTLFLGLLVPGVLVMLIAGVNAHEGLISLPEALALAVLGTVIGDTLSYLMGRFGWSRVGNASVREFTERVREPILRRGPLFVLFYHFAGYTRLVGPAGAGLLRMPYRRWAPADHLGAVLWAGSFMGLGYGLGAAGINLDSTDRWFRYFEWGLLALVAVWLAYLYKKGGSEWLRLVRDKLHELDDRERRKDEAARDPASTAEPDRD